MWLDENNIKKTALSNEIAGNHVVYLCIKIGFIYRTLWFDKANIGNIDYIGMNHFISLKWHVYFVIYFTKLISISMPHSPSINVIIVFEIYISFLRLQIVMCRPSPYFIDVTMLFIC